MNIESIQLLLERQLSDESISKSKRVNINNFISTLLVERQESPSCFYKTSNGVSFKAIPICISITDFKRKGKGLNYITALSYILVLERAGLMRDGIFYLNITDGSIATYYKPDFNKTKNKVSLISYRRNK